MITDTDLVKAWRSTETNVQIGRALALTPRQVRSEFERIARKGLIPHAKRTHVPKAWLRRWRQSGPATSAWKTSDAPILGHTTTVMVAGRDRLLDRLIEVHGGNDWIARDTAAPGALNDG